MLSQMRERRAERKKSKHFVALKKVSLDPSRRSDISTAHANLPKHPITKKHFERSSVALTFAMAFHILIALIVGIFFIADRIEFEDDTLDISMVTEKETPPRPPIVRETLEFDTKPGQTQEAIRQQPVTNLNERLRSSEGFEILQGPTENFDPSIPNIDEGPKVIDVDRPPVRLTPSVEPERKAPGLEREQKPPSFIEKFDTPTPDKAPGLGNINFEIEPGVVLPKREIQIEPDYPENAKKAEKEGEVILQATIDENGIPHDIVAVTNLGFGLEESAIEALKRTTYRPAMKAGKPISLRVEISITFTLEDSD